MVTASAGGLKTWFLETRPQFLILTPICVLVGVAAAAYDDFDLNPVHVILTLVGALLAHISVNVLNDYFDYRSGIDLATKRTPFSGGSGILPGGLLKAPVTNRKATIARRRIASCSRATWQASAPSAAAQSTA